MTKLQACIAGAIVLAGVAVLLVAQHRSEARLRAENEALQQQVAGLQAENESRTNPAAAARPSLTDEQLSELLRLRNEVGMLRRGTNDLERLRLENSRLRPAAANAAPGSPATAEDAEAQQQAAIIGRLGDAKQSCLGLFLFARDNRDQFPTNLDQLTPYLKGALTGTNDFELLCQGAPVAGLTNPGSTIVLRERTARPASKGGWTKVYGFADGHAEAHFESQSSDFDAWETQRMPPPASAPQGQ
jgi:hypothetical protein